LGVWSRIAERRGRRRAQALSRAIAELPPATRRVMLEAAETEELIVGAYTDRWGRMCPILAAHRRGARTHAGAFPRAWDAFGHAHRPRPATERELEILKALLQESLGEASVGRSVAARGSGGRVAGAGAEAGGEPQLTPTGGAQAS
jgi:hypothetical protein